MKARSFILLCLLVLFVIAGASLASTQTADVLNAAKQVQALIDQLADSPSTNELQLGLAWRALNEAEYRLPPDVKASVVGGGPPKGYMACHVMLANAGNSARLRAVQRAHQETQAAIQCYANALGLGSQQPPVDAPTVVFNYYYINGINTPRDGPGRGSDGPERGNYQWDSSMIRGNLLDQGPQVGFNQRPRQPSDLTVATMKERTVFQENREETYNFSGTQPLYTQAGFCESLRTGVTGVIGGKFTVSYNWLFIKRLR